MGHECPVSLVQLLARHEGELVRYVLPLVGNEDDARDVVQDAAVAILKKFGAYDPGKPFLPWAKQFARYEALMALRRRRRLHCDDLPREVVDYRAGAGPPDRQRLDVLRDCVGRLPEADQVLLRLRYAGTGITVRRLAWETGQSVHELYKALARIRLRLLDDVRAALASADRDGDLR